MICPKCGASNMSMVINTRETDDGFTRRRRKCTICGERFTSIELPAIVDGRAGKGICLKLDTATFLKLTRKTDEQADGHSGPEVQAE